MLVAVLCQPEIHLANAFSGVDRAGAAHIRAGTYK